MDTQMLYDALVNDINKSQIPFDAKVFVVRCLVREIEDKYASLQAALKAKAENEAGKDAT